MVSDRCKIVSAGSFSVTILLSSISVSVWIYRDSQDLERTLDVHNKKLNLACHICFTYNISTSNFSCAAIELKCLAEGWQRPTKLPAACEKNEKVKEFIGKEVKRQFRNKMQDFVDKELDMEEKAFLSTAKEAFYEPRRTIIHWSPNVTAWDDRIHADKWQSIKHFERTGFTFTITPGDENSFDNGKVNITETGMYLIYARLSFACTLSSQIGDVRVHMEVVVHETPEYKFVVLKDSQTATCSMEGDLVTLFQSGIFRLGENEKVELKHKAPKGVRLSRKDWIHKSTFGLVRIGLA